MKGYCFKGTAVLIVYTRPLKTFVVYGKTPTAAASAKAACEIYRKNPKIQEEKGFDVTNSVCQVPELVFFKECPVECDTVQMIPRD